MTYCCPKCGRYGMEWDGRAKVLMCHYNTCRHVIRMVNQKSIPSPKRISTAISKEFRALHNRTPDDSVYAY